MNLYLVRHGETEHNKNQCYYGRSDVELTKKGILQGEKVAELLKNIKFDKVFVSERKRAVKTAEILLKSNQHILTKDTRINEINFGIFEGKSYKEIQELYPRECKKWCEDWKNDSPPEGESYLEFYSRINSFMNDIIKLDLDNVLIVAHSGVIRSIYCYVLGGDLNHFWSFSSKNGDISIVKYEYGNLYIDSITHV